MAAGKKIHCKVLKDYTRPIVHLRHQVEDKRFGLVLGAGVGSNFRIPKWEALVEKIARSPEVKGVMLLKGDVKEKSLPYKTQMLFQRFRDRTISNTGDMSDLAKQSAITDGWLKLCATHIYSQTDTNFNKALRSHPYFMALLPLVRKSHLTINFNFDDYLERALGASKKAGDRSKGYEVVTDPWPQFRRKDSVIYHPHGVVPAQTRRMEIPTDRFIFSEAAYSAQYLGSKGHDSSFLLTHFARNTCLILGCSLEDELRNVLMRGAQINPGNYHYYVHYINDDGSGIRDEQKKLISETNFNVYNLITLFLTSKEIKALLELINQEEISKQDFENCGKRAGVELKYIYYLTGPLGVGKSTTTAQLRSLNVLDEWLEARPPFLAIPWDELNEKDRQKADKWIANQFYEKNNTLLGLDPSISSVDRPPLDPLVFTKKEDRPVKAKHLLDTIRCPERKLDIVSGVVILLTGDEVVLSARVRTTGRGKYTPDRIKEMQESMCDIYSGEGTHKIDTRHLSILEVTKKVAEIIHRKEYQPFNLMEALENYERGGDGNI